jgi:hypothetical protein
MSIAFSDPDLQPTYQGIISGSADYDWAMFNQTANELKVQATGSGLNDLEEEFMDGRWASVLTSVQSRWQPATGSSTPLHASKILVYVDPGRVVALLIAQSSLDKFVLIDWCGEGVPESRKGLFRGSMADQIETGLQSDIADTQSSQVSSKFLRGAHLVIQARSDVGQRMVDNRLIIVAW